MNKIGFAVFTLFVVGFVSVFVWSVNQPDTIRIEREKSEGLVWYHVYTQNPWDGSHLIWTTQDSLDAWRRLRSRIHGTTMVSEGMVNR